MGKERYFRQCRLTCEAVTTVSWIPAECAIEGATVRLKDKDGWSVWRVEKASGTIVPEEWLKHQEQSRRDRESTLA